jgi:hypothetical protein
VSTLTFTEKLPLFSDGRGGFGDQFERYAHLLNIARLLKATAVAVFTKSGKGGSSEYIKLARLMNINLDLQHQYKKYNISRHLSFRSLDEIEKIHSEILINNGSSPSLPCHSVVRVNMYDCSGTWCSFVLKEIHEVKWILRNNSFVSHCAKNKMGFQRQRGKVNVLWHVRSGDLCIRCKDAQYFDSLLQMIHSAVQHRAQTVTQLLYPYTVCTSMHVCTYICIHVLCMYIFAGRSASLLQHTSKWSTPQPTVAF